MMTYDEIQKMTAGFEREYPDGGYVSRCTIWHMALRDGRVTDDQVNEAKKYYGSLWNYTGD